LGVKHFNRYTRVGFDGDDPFCRKVHSKIERGVFDICSRIDDAFWSACVGTRRQVAARSGRNHFNISFQYGADNNRYNSMWPGQTQVGAPTKALRRIEGLAALRGVLAVWVILSHVALPWNFSHATVLGSALQFASNNAFCGVAAVIAFFLVSGLCIHFSNRHELTVDLVPHLVRRSLRIGLPLAVAIGLAWNFRAWELPLWSLYCEEIYYFLYPALLVLRRRRASWWPLIWVSFAGALGIALSHPQYKNYWESGIGLTWALGLPCWLLGCALADSFDELTLKIVPAKGQRQIWAWRMGAAFGGAFCSALRFHTPLGYPLTLTLFAFFIFVWLQKEILLHNGLEARRPGPVAAVLTWLGQRSFSLYLLHLPIFAVIGRQVGWDSLLGSVGIWALKIALTLLVAHIFYVLVERPAHFLARRISLPGRAGGGEPKPADLSRPCGIG
jgi:peptidoglycan/LPS O-acetylase OafA/YrhL